MKLVKLTIKDGEDDGEDLWLNPEHIVHVMKHEGETEIRLVGNEDHYVQEEPGEINRLIEGGAERPLVLATAKDRTGAWRG